MPTPSQILPTMNLWTLPQCNKDGLMLQAAATACNGLNHLHFDTESVPIQVDNCCSKCITNDIKDATFDNENN